MAVVCASQGQPPADRFSGALVQGLMGETALCRVSALKTPYVGTSLMR